MSEMLSYLSYLVPVEPPVTVHARGVDWEKFLFPAIACMIVAALIIGIWRALPKWILVVVVVLCLAVAGIITLSVTSGGH